MSIDMTPFKALYGHDCLSPLNFSDPTIRVEASKQMLEEMNHQVKAFGVKAKVAGRPSNSLTLIHVYTLYSFF